MKHRTSVDPYLRTFIDCWCHADRQLLQSNGKGRKEKSHNDEDQLTSDDAKGPGMSEIADAKGGAVDVADSKGGAYDDADAGD